MELYHFTEPTTTLKLLFPSKSLEEPALCFDDFRLDRRDGVFRRRESGQEQPVTLGSRALDVLMALVERHGTLVTKQALMDAAWPGMAVEDSNLAVQISSLRRVLDEDRTGGSCIQTVIGRGYRFLPSVAVEPPPGANPGSGTAGRLTRPSRNDRSV